MEIDIEKVLNYMRDHATKYAQAKANRVYLEEFRKTLKSKQMIQAQKDGVSALAAQERDAYASPEYETLLDGLKVAVEEEEALRWMLIAAQAKVEVWRSMQATNRAEGKNV